MVTSPVILKKFCLVFRDLTIMMKLAGFKFGTIVIVYYSFQCPDLCLPSIIKDLLCINTGTHFFK